MCSSAVWPSGSRTRWAGSRGRVHRFPEGGARHPARGVPAGRWGCPSPGSISGRTGSCRRGQRGGSGSKPRSGGCSPRMRASTGRRGSPRTLRDEGWRVSENTVAALMREQGLAARRRRRGRKATTTARQGPLAGTGPGQAGLRRRRDQPELVWRRHRDPHRRGQAVSRLGAGRGLAPGACGFALGEHHDAELAYGALAMAVAVRGGHVPGVIVPHRPGQRVHRAAVPRQPARGWRSPSRWAGPGRRWTTR